MVAFNMSMRESAQLVRHARIAPEQFHRFRAFAALLGINSAAELRFFGRACGIDVQFVEVTEDEIASPTHPLHFLSQKMPAPPDE